MDGRLRRGIGRKLSGIARRSFQIVDTLAWVSLDTAFAPGGLAHNAARSIAAAVRRDKHEELAARVGEWIEDLHSLAERGEFLCSVNDYAVLLRKPAA